MEKIKYPSSPQFYSLDKYPALKKNWEFTHDKLYKLNTKLNEELDSESLTIVAAGSYGRLDASDESDLDYMILSERSDETVKKCNELMRRLCQEYSIKLPNATGVFSEIIPVNEMIKKIGETNDNLVSLAQRMLLLMESRPIYNENMYRAILDKLLRKYLYLVIEDTNKECIFFLNDIIRYFRSICVNYQFNFFKEEDKWVIRNIKLRHSRIIMYTGLLLLTVNASKHREEKDNKYNYLKPWIELTPLEKIVHVYIDNNDSSYHRILGIYNTFIRKISDKDIRRAMKVDYDERYTNPFYAELKVNSDSLQSELTRFILKQRMNWTDQIFEYLFF